MSEVDDAIAAARSSWSRISDTGQPAAPRNSVRTRGQGARRVKRIALAMLAVLVAAFAIGFVTPIGIMGVFMTLVALVGVAMLFAILPAASDRAPPPEKLKTVDIKALPAQTERWLHAQRRLLPAPAQHLVDRIGDRLGTLAPQLARVDANSESALEIRRLVGEQLPAFVDDYARVPEPLRRTDRNGRTPDAALVDGLSVIEREIAAMTERLAQGDLDSLQTRGRYLEMKYTGDGAPG
ncbi:hypothetical protein ASG67_09515 [Sphingomonas sp. Leaf339]|uniref:hypothetical protein n=1 Tax=Sphingomonas sp. Leaf339 TaxID=1736343 RepID=UPI000700DD5B|nr:hypothetical protein [Sphingomonas sp. Leaf339]KQU53070.1 hypothetical protein ASG67_09515 [Sphingomonas sp. Leaf339]